MASRSISTRAVFEGGMAFDVELDGHTLRIDAAPDFDGSDSGPRPKGLLLASLAGCTGMDVVSILRKMKIPDDEYELSIEVDAALTDDHPVVFSSVCLRYRFLGDGLPVEKLRRAVELSQERYCGVSAMLSRVAELTWSIEVEKPA